MEPVDFIVFMGGEERVDVQELQQYKVQLGLEDKFCSASPRRCSYSSDGS